MSRATVPVVGVLLLLSITVLSAAAIGLVVSNPPPQPPPTASFDLSVDAASDQIELTHLGGDAIDLTETSLQISVEGTQLSQQPPVPFFAAEGFKSGPTGPFNVASPNRWHAGETASLGVASTNDPEISAGDTVQIRIIEERGSVTTVTETA